MATDKKISDLAVATAPTGVELIEIVQGGVNKQTTTQHIADLAGGGGGTSIPFGITSGTTTLTATMSPTVTAYANGDLYMIRAGATTVGTATLNLDSVGAKNIYDTPEKEISIDDLVQGRSYLIQYDTALNASAGGFIVIGELGHERLSFRDNFDASGNAFPITGGSGYQGDIRLGDLWRITVAGTLDGVPVSVGDIIIALAGGPTVASWMILYGYASIDTKLALKAPLASPTFTGTPAAPTAAAATNTTQVATTAFVQQEIASKVDEETFATLTFASPTVWNNNSRQTPLAKVTATGDFTLDMTNVKSGAQGVLVVTASTASAFTLTFDTDFTNTEISTGASLLTYTFPADNGQVYYLFYVCDGTSLSWTIVDLQATDPTPFAQIARSTAQSINNNDTSVPVTFATEVHDNSAIWASSPNPTRFVIPGSGDKIAYLSIRAQWAVNSTGMRRNIPYLNGSTTGDIAQAGAIASTATIINTTHQIACAGGDYIEIVCYQNSGSALDLDLCQVRISIVDR